MANRQTRGRQRIPISRIQNQDDMYATFSKRRLGLFKKASELSTLCGVDIGVIIFSPTNNPYSFFHPTMESVVNRYMNPNQPQDTFSRIVESTTRSRIDALNRELDEVLEHKQAAKEEAKYLDEIDKTRPKGWWEETPIESLDGEQVNEWIQWFQDFKAQVESRIEQLQSGGASTSNFSAAGPSTQVGPSMFAASNMGMVDQFQSHSNYLAQDPLMYANEIGHSSQYFIPQDPPAASCYNSQDPFAAASGSSTGHIPNSIFSSHGIMDDGYIYPQPPQYPSTSTVRLGGDPGNSQFFQHAPPPLYSSSNGVGTNPAVSGSTTQYVHPQIGDPSNANANAAGTSGAAADTSNDHGGQEKGY